jgi:hypothetical protein
VGCSSGTSLKCAATCAHRDTAQSQCAYICAGHRDRSFTAKAPAQVSTTRDNARTLLIIIAGASNRILSSIALNAMGSAGNVFADFGPKHMMTKIGAASSPTVEIDWYVRTIAQDRYYASRLHTLAALFSLPSV